MVKMLGIDYGDARTGLAYSDDLGLLAIGAGCVKSYNPEKAADEIVAKAKEMGIGLMVLGKPLNMNGTEGPRAQACKDFAEMLIPIAIRKKPRQYIRIRLTDSLSKSSVLIWGFTERFSVLIFYYSPLK